MGTVLEIYIVSSIYTEVLLKQLQQVEERVSELVKQQQVEEGIQFVLFIRDFVHNIICFDVYSNHVSYSCRLFNLSTVTRGFLPLPAVPEPSTIS